MTTVTQKHTLATAFAFIAVIAAIVIWLQGKNTTATSDCYVNECDLYISDRIGISFEYPEGWVVEESNGQIQVFPQLWGELRYPPYATPGLGGDGVWKPPIEIEIENDTATTLSQVSFSFLNCRDYSQESIAADVRVSGSGRTHANVRIVWHPASFLTTRRSVALDFAAYMSILTSLRVIGHSPEAIERLDIPDRCEIMPSPKDPQSHTALHRRLAS